MNKTQLTNRHSRKKAGVLLLVVLFVMSLVSLVLITRNNETIIDEFQEDTPDMSISSPEEELPQTHHKIVRANHRETQDLSLAITFPTEGMILKNKHITTTWETTGDFDYFEIYLDNELIGKTTNHFYYVEVPNGWHTLTIFGYAGNQFVFDSVYFDPVPSDQYYFVNPDGGDSWTENTASSWGNDLVTVSDESGIKEVGSYSVKGTLPSVFTDECNDESVDTSLYDVYSEGSGYATEDTSHITIWSSPTNGHWAFLSFDATNYPLSGDYNVTFRMRDCWGPGGRILWLSFCKSSDIPNKNWAGPKLYSSTSSDSPLSIHDGSSSEQLRSTTDTEYTITVTRVGSTVTVYYNDTQEWSGTFTEPGGAHDTFSFGVTGSSTGNRDVNLDWFEYNYDNKEFYYNSSKDLSLDCENKYENMNFRIRQDNQTDDPQLRLYENSTNYFYRTVDVTSADTWQTESLEVGSGASGWSSQGSADWSNITYISFYYNTSETTITAAYIDGLYFDSTRTFAVDSPSLVSTNITPSYTTDINEIDITATDSDSFDVSWNGTSWSLTNIVYGSDNELDFTIGTDFETHNTTLVFSEWEEDTTVPTIDLTSPANESTVKDGETIDLDVSDPNLDIVLYNWDGASNQTLDSPYDIPISSLSDGNRTLNVYANDTVGNENSSIFQFEVDNTAPTISHDFNTQRNPVYPDDLDDYCYTNATISDALSNLETVLISHNTTGTMTNYTMNNFYGGSTYNYTIDISGLSATDVVEYLFYANDTVDNPQKEDNSGQNYSFEIGQSDNNPPIITLTSPSNNSIVKDDDVIDLHISDLNLNVTWYNWDGGDNTTFSSPWQIPISGLSDGNRTLNVYANDTFVNEAHKVYQFEIDNTAPVVTLNSPANESTVKDEDTINLSISDALDNLATVLYNWDSGTNSTLNSPYDIPITGLSDGNRTLNVYANDTKDNWNSKIYQFEVDNTAPVITLDNPTNDTIVSGSTWFNFTITDISAIEWVKINWNGADNVTIADPYDHLNDTTLLSDGTNALYAYANDSQGNISSKIYVFTVDNTAPVITLDSPANESTVEQNDPIDLSVSDLSSFTVVYNWDGASNTTLSSPYDIMMPYDSHAHYLNVYANDSQGYSSSKKYVFIATTAPGAASDGPGGGPSAKFFDDVTIEYKEIIYQDAPLDIKITIGVSGVDVQVVIYGEVYDVPESETETGVYEITIPANTFEVGSEEFIVRASKSGYNAYISTNDIRVEKSRIPLPVSPVIRFFAQTQSFFVQNTQFLLIAASITIVLIAAYLKREELSELLGIEKPEKPKALRAPPGIRLPSAPSFRFDPAVSPKLVGKARTWTLFAMISVGLSIWMLHSIYTGLAVAGGLWFYSFIIAFPLGVIMYYDILGLGEKGEEEPHLLFGDAPSFIKAIMIGFIITLTSSVAIYQVITAYAQYAPIAMWAMPLQFTDDVQTVWTQILVGTGENLGILVLISIIADLFGLEDKRLQMLISSSVFASFHFWAASVVAPQLSFYLLWVYFLAGGMSLWLVIYGGRDLGIPLIDKIPRGGFVASVIVHSGVNLLIVLGNIVVVI